MNIIEKLKSLNVEITPEVETALAGEFVSEMEVKKKTDKIAQLETELKAERDSKTMLETKLSEMQDISSNAETYKKKIDELNDTIERERADRAAKDEQARLTGVVTDFLADKQFLNDFTANAIKSQLSEELQKDTAKGKSIQDIFDSLVKDEKGELKPNILVDQKDIDAQKRRSSIVGNSIEGIPTPGTKLTTLQLMKLKNQYPDLDISQFKK